MVQALEIESDVIPLIDLPTPEGQVVNPPDDGKTLFCDFTSSSEAFGFWQTIDLQDFADTCITFTIEVAPSFDITPFYNYSGGIFDVQNFEAAGVSVTWNF